MYTEDSLRKETIAGFQKIKERNYWLNKLSGELLKTSIPYDYKGQPHEYRCIGDGAGKFGRVTFTLSGNEFSKLMRMCSGADTRLQMVLIMILTVLLNKYTGHRDIIIATPIYHQKMEGEFINTVLAVRNRLQKNITFKELLLQVRQTLTEAVEHQEYPIRVLLQDLKISYDYSRESFPLMDNAILVKNIQDKSYLRPVHPNITYSFLRTDQALEGEIEYAAQLYERGTIRRIARHFIHLLKVALSDMDLQITGVEILTQEEKHQLLVEFNNTKAAYPGNKTIHELFRQQVDKTPDHIAALGTNKAERKDVHITYRALAIKSNQQARWLRKNGVTGESVVGIMMERSPSVIVVLLAILKAGAAYLPIDPDLPAARIRYMLEDSGAKTLLTHSRFLESISFTALRNFEPENSPGIVTTGSRQHIKDFNRLPVPDRSLIDLSRYKDKIGMASVTHCISLQATRGCPYECVFCHKVWSKKHVYRSAENIFSEVLYYYKRGTRNFAIIDDCFNLNRKNSTSFYQLLIKNKLNIKLFFPNGLRGDLLTPGDIDLMAAAGTRGINLSLETASPRLQKVIKKNLDIPRFKEIMDYIAAAHPEIILEIATMHGFPTETTEEAMMTLDFIKSIRWIHFPYIHILKIYPNTEMEKLALEQGISPKDILASRALAYHELPETLPFPKSFTRRYQSDFMNHYFLSKERLRQVLPVQMQILTREALVQKYNTYLPVEIKTIDDLLGFTGLEDLEMPQASDSASPGPSTRVPAREPGVPYIFDRKAPGQDREKGKNKGKAKRILLLDLSQHFSSHSMLYNVVEQPLGLISLLTYLEQQLGDEIDGRVYKAGIDFDSFDQLKHLVRQYKPHLVGIRALTFYREFFHETASLLKQLAPGVPIIAGGPYATSDYRTLLQDRHIDLVVLGEGEYTLAELIRWMLKKGFKIPGPEILKQIHGIAFAQHKQDHAADTSCDVILYDRVTDLISGQDPSDLNVPVSPRSLAYVMYTSGSTGKPGGVMVEHQPVNNCISWMQNKFHLTPNDIIIQRTNLTFDPSVWEIFWPLYVGGRVRVLPPGPARDAGYLIDLMAEPGSAAVMYCPSTLVVAMNYVLDKKPGKPRLTMPWLIIGAEPITMDAVKNFYSYFEGKIVNTYGPTEGTINNTYFDLEPGDERSIVPIGKPTANNQIYILSRDMQPMPIGTAGEICIAGDSLARGYINNRQKTDANFIPNPFGPGKLYKTGDMARWWEDGNIEILGRSDDQVKIRGHRIEMGEVQTALLRHPSIDDAVVITKNKEELQEDIRECKKCGIWSNYPGITVNNDNLCSVCENMDKYQTLINQYFKTPADFERKIREGNKNKKGKYDCLLVYACERVATYALYKLMDMGFKVLTVTYDSGHYDQSSLDRIKRITTQIGVDHIFLHHKNSDQILKESLKSAHTMCKGCIHTSTSLAAEYAYKNNIKFVIGETLSRGQIIDNKLYKFMEKGIFDAAEIEKENLKLIKQVASIDKKIFDVIDIDIMKDGTAYDVVEFIDFYRYFDITNQEMAAYLDEKDAYWKNLENRAAYSTDCKICMVGDYNHFKNLGYHYTGSAKSWEQRLGLSTLQNVKKELTLAITGKEHSEFLRNLGYQTEISIEEVEKHLCAYFVSKRELLVTQLREYLSTHIPDYMLPSYFIPLEKIPLTPNGKIDRKALPKPEIRDGADYVPPANETEQKLVHIWSEVLDLKEENIGVTSDFFEMGGHSLRAMVLEAQIHKEFNVKVPLLKIFQNPTIRDLARYTKEEAGEAFAPICAVEKKDYYMPASSQKRMFIRHQMGFDSIAYNTTVMVRLEGELEKGKLEETFKNLIQRHESLRTSFRMIDGKPVYRVQELGNLKFKMEFYDAGETGSREQSIESQGQGVDEITRGFVKTFDLSRAPLIRVGLVKLQNTPTALGAHPRQGAYNSQKGKKDKYLLMVDMHHIITDHVSLAVLITDFLSLYKGLELPGLKLQYKDYSEWQINQMSQGKIKNQEEYWLKRFQDGIPILQMPTDYPRPRVRDDDKGDQITFFFEDDVSRKVVDLTKETGSTLFIVLLAAFYVLMAKYSKQEDIVVGVPITGRSHADLQNIIGVFLNMLALRNFPRKEMTFKEFLTGVRDNTIQDYENQDYHLEELVNRLEIPRDVSRNPLFDVEFSMLSEDINEIDIPGLKLTPVNSGVKFSKFDLHALVLERDEKIGIELRYSTQLFKAATIELIKEDYLKVLKQLSENINIRLKDVTISGKLLPAQAKVSKDKSADFDF
jgi:amino acid adenylation domain-containing protein